MALGSFDGLHTGHMRVIEKCVEVARERGLTPAVMLFDSHPLESLCGKAPECILTDFDRQSLLDRLGVTVQPVSFPLIRDMDVENFIRRVLFDKNVKAVCCGFNYRFAKDRQGDASTLQTECARFGIEAFVLDGCMLDGSAVSSTRIRAALHAGELSKANAMLGRPFLYTLPVIHGDHRGTGMGFPTANQMFPEGFCVPKYGVYASRTKADGAVFPSVTNIGVRPTVGGNRLLSETNLIGFSGDLYGKSVTVELLEYLRPERTFQSLRELSEQIVFDADRAYRLYQEAREKENG